MDARESNMSTELARFAIKEMDDNKTEYHFPGQEFTGPGTHIATKILTGVVPKNHTDFVTMLHDLAYLHNHSSNESDNNAILDSDLTLPGIATKIGLQLRKNSTFRFTTKDDNAKIAYELYNKIPKGYFIKYGINKNKYDNFFKRDFIENNNNINDTNIYNKSTDNYHK